MNVNQKIEKLWMNVEKGLGRFSWRFKNGNFTPNQNDINALNGIIQWVNDQRKITLNQNHLFAKLYIYYFNEYLDKYQASVFSDIPQKELSKLLDTPLQLFYQAFVDSLNQNNIYQVMIDNKISMTHPWERTKEEEVSDRLGLKNMSKADREKMTSMPWKYDEVEYQLNKMVTEAINRFQ